MTPYNISEDIPAPTDDSSSDDYSIYMGPLQYYFLISCPITLIANAFVIISAFVKTKSAKTAKLTYVCSWNISMVNFLSCLTIMALPYDPNKKISKIGCGFYLGSVLCDDLTLMISICLLAVERYFFIVRGRKFDLTRWQKASIMLAIWAFAFCFGLLPSVVHAANMPGDSFIQCEVLKSTGTGASVALIMTVLGCVVVPIVYIWVYHHVKRTPLGTTIDSEIHKLHLKSVILVLLLSLTALCTAFPFILLVAWRRFLCAPLDPRCMAMEYSATAPIACVGFTSTLIYPFIYAWWHPPYNRSIKKLLCSRRLKLFKAGAKKEIHTLHQ